MLEASLVIWCITCKGPQWFHYIYLSQLIWINVTNYTSYTTRMLDSIFLIYFFFIIALSSYYAFNQCGIIYWLIIKMCIFTIKPAHLENLRCNSDIETFFGYVKHLIENGPTKNLFIMIWCSLSYCIHQHLRYKRWMKMTSIKMHCRNSRI